MNAAAFSSIDAYLTALRAALGNADAALVQDALYDAEEYLRSEVAEHPQLDEASVVAKVASSYGSPDDVAAIYRDTEAKVTEALRTPPAQQRRSLLGRFFGVAADARTYAGLFYMVFALATGIFYFTVAVTGVSMSVGLAILIIGVPFIVLFVGIVRVLSLVEGRLVETLLGERMPRRPLYADRGKPIMERIKEMFTDPRTWSTLLYFVLMLPIGIVYFTIATVGLTMSLGFIAAPIAVLFGGEAYVNFDGLYYDGPPPAVLLPLIFVAGVLLLFTLLHVARGVATLHGRLAKNLLVKTAQY